MKSSLSGQTTNVALIVESEVPEVDPQQYGEVIPLDSNASKAIVQCLLIAARRGRQIRLAREQATQRQQGESGLVGEETV